MKSLFRTVLFISFVVLIFLKPEYISEIDSSLLSLFSLLTICLFSWHLYLQAYKYKNWFRIDVLFLLGYLIVHFQWPIMYSLSGILPENSSRIWVNSFYVNYGIWLSTIGGISWLLGYSMYITPNYNPVHFFFRYKYSKLLNFTIGLFTVFILTAGRDFLTGGVYKGSGGSASGEGIAAYVQLLFSICIIILTVFIILENKGHYKGNLLKWILSLNKKYLFLVFSYILLFFAIGDRGGPLSLIITFLTLIGAVIRPFKLRELMVIVFSGALLMTIIGLGRSSQTDDGILISGYKELTFDSGYDPTTQLAGSIRTLFYSLSDVPQNRDFFFGKLWLGGMMSPIPFLQSTYLSITSEDRHDISSSSYITYLVYGIDAPSGEGTSLIADIYLNFGLPGIMICMFLLGMMIKRANDELFLQRNYRWLIIAAIIASFALIFGRNSFLIILRPIVWSWVVVYLLTSKVQVKT